MWSKVNFNNDEPYTPNHFVQLFKHTENILITISEEEENSNVTNPINDQSLELIVNIPRNDSNVTNDPEYQDNLFQKEYHQTHLSDTDDILLSVGKNLVLVHSSGTPIFSTKFLDITEIVEILKSPTFVHTSIPDGLKNNVYFILDEKKNIERKSYGKPPEFYDDCGAWDRKGKGAPTTYHVKGEIISLITFNNSRSRVLQRASNKSPTSSEDRQQLWKANNSNLRGATRLDLQFSICYCRI